ncbi:MAG: BatD family protein [Treponema sp.]|nr:BatD family protein [Treponema sp.]
MKTFLLTFAFLTAFLVNINAQSNWPMATELKQREDLPVLPAAPEKRITTHILIWEASGEMTFKTRQTLTLRANSLIDRLPPPSFFMPKVPQNAILSSAAITPQEKSRGIVLKLTLIPLSAGSFTIPAYTLTQDENTKFEIPALRVLVKE